MKYLHDISDLVPLKERIAKSHDFVDSNQSGSINFCAVKLEGSAPFLKVWRSSGSVFDPPPLRVQAFGSFTEGEMLVSAFKDKNFQLTLFGKGKKLEGKALFVQHVDNVFNVVYNSDAGEDKQFFRMTATTDSEILEILFRLALDNFPEITKEEAQKTMQLLSESKGGAW